MCALLVIVFIIMLQAKLSVVNLKHSFLFLF